MLTFFLKQEYILREKFLRTALENIFYKCITNIISITHLKKIFFSYFSKIIQINLYLNSMNNIQIIRIISYKLIMYLMISHL